MPSNDWLNEESEAEAQRKAEQLKDAVEFAQLYVDLFERNQAGKKLLQHWIDTIETMDIAPTCSHAEYAHHEARRAFIRGIQRQVKLGLTGSYK